MSVTQKKLLTAASLLLSTLISTSVWSQTTYSCKTDSGISYRSLSPCPRATKSELIYYGPAQERRPSQQRHVPRVERAGEEQAYMSAKCVTMQEGIRTAPNRGLSSATIRELRQTFDRECREEHSNALRALRKDQRAQEKQAEDEQELALQQKLRSQEEEDRFRRQCAEMRMAIHSRKQRTNPTEGELRDLQLFEARYQSRCIKS